MTDTQSWKKARTSGNWIKVLKTHAPALHREFAGIVAASSRRGKVPEKLKHLIWVAVDSVGTHLFAPGAALHAEEALANGATVGELMDTLRIASLPLNDGLKEGYAALAAVLKEAGRELPDQGGDLSPEFTRAYQAFAHSSSPGGLDERSRCLVALAVFACPAVIDRKSMEASMREGLRLGIEPDEMLEAMELASLIGTHAFASGLDRMAPAMDERAVK
jgi:alkylhydroperoxidase/carboxymuconolactone decarboxylase family protein YurZ